MASSLSPGGELSAASSSLKVRFACDRCHSQKLRCVRKSGHITCNRCAKRGDRCKFSPRAPRASLKPSDPAASTRDGIHGPTLSMPTPTSNVCADVTLNTTTTSTASGCSPSLRTRELSNNQVGFYSPLHGPCCCLATRFLSSPQISSRDDICDL